MDSCTNEYLLLIHRGNGEITYSLTGKNNGIPHSLSNLGLRSSLPFADTGLKNEELLSRIVTVLITGYKQITNFISVPDHVLNEAD